MSNTIYGPFHWTEQTIAGNCAMLMESMPWTIYWFSQIQKKEHLTQMREIQFRECSADTEWIKCNTNGVKTGSSKNIDLLKVKRERSWIQWNNKIQQHFCWRPLNSCYKCAKLIPSKVCSKFLVMLLHTNHGGFQCQV